MKDKCIQTKLLDSNKAYWIKWKTSAFKQSYLIQIKLINQMKHKCIQTKLIELNKAYYIKSKPSAFKQSKLIQIKLTELNERQVYSNKANWFK